MKINNISQQIIGSAIEVHKIPGPGLLESAYKECLFYELFTKKIKVEKEIPMPVVYKEIKLDHGYRIDLLFEKAVVVEIKTVEAFTDFHLAQVLTYLKLGGYTLGLLINFNVSMLKHGIRRVIH